MFCATRKQRLCVLTVLAIFLLAGYSAWLSAQVQDPTPQKKAKLSEAARKPWNTSRVVGSPDPPPPFKIVRAFPEIKFNRPLLMARMPGSDRFFVGEHAGVLYSFPNRADAKADLFIDLRKEIKTMALCEGANVVGAVYGLTFHPRFEENRYCYVCYTLRGPKPNLPDGSRISRFTVTKTDPPRADPASEEVVFTYMEGGHNGGDIHFGPDGMLYISTGDGSGPTPPDPRNTGQDISDLLSSILRIDVDHKDKGKNHAVPKDNPFVSTPGARPEIWAYGFRNPWRMSFDPKAGNLYVGDVGWELWESVIRVEKGGNYGWSAFEASQPIKPDKVGPTPILPPLIELPHTVACSVTGGRVYHGKKFEELRGAYIFGDWETRRIWAARFENDRLKEMPEITRPSVRVVAFGEDKDGEIYFLDYDTGTVHTIERNSDAKAQNTQFPKKLSQTGIFASVKDKTPAVGVEPFTINSRQWQDGATAQYWAAFTGESFATLHAEGKPIPGNVYWHNFRMHFPKDAVLVKTLSLGKRRVETQLLHFDGEDWHGYTFAWREDQTDADLAPAEGDEKEIAFDGRKQVWQFHSRAQCVSCHHSLGEYALAFQPGQLNRDDGRDECNQLISLTQNGLIRRADKDGKPLPPFDHHSVNKEVKLADPTDMSKSVDARARAYLHANCGHCHCEHGGGTVSLRLHSGAERGEMKAIGVAPSRGDFGLPKARIIQPGDPASSTLYFRMGKFGRDRMPHIGAELPDEFGLRLVGQWITELGNGQKRAEPNLDGLAPERLLEHLSTAQAAARKIGRGEMKPVERDRLLVLVAKLPSGATRDLFEGFLPQGKDGERKLGANPRPASILAVKGDAGRGEKLFWSKTVQCGNCHKVGERGKSIGPDLSLIGKLRTRPDLLESMLQPSRRIEPKFSGFAVRTLDGKSVTGILLKRDEKEIIVRDPEGKDFTFATGDVESLRPLRISLMPDGQMAGLTATEAADLLEYLTERR